MCVSCRATSSKQSYITEAHAKKSIAAQLNDLAMELNKVVKRLVCLGECIIM